MSLNFAQPLERNFSISQQKHAAEAALSLSLKAIVGNDLREANLLQNWHRAASDKTHRFQLSLHRLVAKRNKSTLYYPVGTSEAKPVSKINQTRKKGGVSCAQYKIKSNGFTDTGEIFFFPFRTILPSVTSSQH